MDKRQEAFNLTHIANQQAMVRIDSLISVMDELTKQPLYDSRGSQAPTSQEPDIMQILRESNKTGRSPDDNGIISEDIKNDPAVTYARTTAENVVVDKLLKRILLFDENIHSVFLFNKYGKYEYRMEQYALKERLNSHGEPWYEECLSLNGRVYFFIGKDFHENFRNFAQKEYHFSIARAVVDTQSVSPIGIICINIEKNFFRETCRNIMTIPGERVLILDGENHIVYDTVEDNIAKDISQVGLSLPDATKSGNDRSVIINDEKHLIDTVDSPNYALRLVRIIPENKLFSNLIKMQEQFMLLIMVFVLLSLILSISLTYGITRPMKKLISTMRVVEKGDLSIRFQVRQKDEIGLLGHSFNKMIRKVENLINIVYISQIRKKEAELDALQSQINPHFIYNTLESIRMMAELNDDAETSRMTFMLARLLRYSISTKKQKVTVKQEIEHLRNYLELQNMRYEDKFELTVDLDDDLYNVGIIKLIFQPVVENAIVHGLEGIQGKGIIRVSGYHTDDRIIFTIEDNGKGIPADRLEELNRKINDFGPGEGGNGGIGLKNVNERIQLHYGDSYGLKLWSEPKKGTAVILEFPDMESMNKVAYEAGQSAIESK
jgi:two-component system sensor histidine kinase YesM